MTHKHLRTETSPDTGSTATGGTAGQVGHMRSGSGLVAGTVYGAPASDFKGLLSSGQKGTSISMTSPRLGTIQTVRDS